MSLDLMGYHFGYWAARCGAPGIFLSASVRVGYQHGAVDQALDSRTISTDLRLRLRALSGQHERWLRAARAKDRLDQHAAGEEARRLMTAMREDEEALKVASPALWARVHVAPGIGLVL